MSDRDGRSLTDVELAAIRERTNAATLGPWCHREGFIETCSEPSQLLGVTLQRSEEGLDALPGLANAEFIAQARTDVPRLLAEIDRLRSELAQCSPRPGSSLVNLVAGAVHGQ
ncbi:MAG TPA: hypothetical protein VM165_16025 [Planctomycetaceae bacterium]|nr:hypothetical protein [Planctomycetaceae bacterium]